MTEDCELLSWVTLRETQEPFFLISRDEDANKIWDTAWDRYYESEEHYCQLDDVSRKLRHCFMSFVSDVVLPHVSDECCRHVYVILVSVVFILRFSVCLSERKSLCIPLANYSCRIRCDVWYLLWCSAISSTLSQISCFSVTVFIPLFEIKLRFVAKIGVDAKMIPFGQDNKGLEWWCWYTCDLITWEEEVSAAETRKENHENLTPSFENLTNFM